MFLIFVPRWLPWSMLIQRFLPPPWYSPVSSWPEGSSFNTIFSISLLVKREEQWYFNASIALGTGLHSLLISFNTASHLRKYVLLPLNKRTKKLLEEFHIFFLAAQTLLIIWLWFDYLVGSTFHPIWNLVPIRPISCLGKVESRGKGLMVEGQSSRKGRVHT